MTSRRLFAPLFLLALSALLLTGGLQAQDSARARVIHLASDIPALDIRVNSELAVANLAYGDASAYFAMPAGAAELTAYDEAGTAVLTPQPLSLEADASTIILGSDASAPPTVFADDLSPLAFGLARLFVVNARDASAAIELVDSDGGLIAGETVAPGGSLGPYALQAAAVEFSALPRAADDAAPRFEFAAALSAGSSHLLIMHGAADDPQLLHASAALDGVESSGPIRFVHAVQGAAPFDLKIDDQMILPSLAFGQPSAPIAIPAGTRQLTLSLGDTVISSAELEVRAGEMQTAVIMGGQSALEVQAFPDALEDLNESSALVSLVNAVPASSVSRLRLDSGAIIAADVAFAQSSGPAQIAPGSHALSLSLEIGEDRGTIDLPAARFYAGAYYNLIALAGSPFSAPSLLIAESSLMRRVKAPAPPPAAPAEDEGDDMAAESLAAPGEPVAPEPPLDPPDLDGAEETESAAESDSDADAPSPALSDVEPPAEVNPDLIAASPYATVALDPSARLQLRQYPSADALSLGLLPGGSTLIVLGRRGATDFYPEDNPDLPLDLSDFEADPAAELYPAQDLPPADTWLFVMYQTEDGGALLGWVNALYVRVFDESGADQRLASLPMVRQNRAGSAYNTAMKPPELADSVTVLVHRLSPGAMLNLRMGNDPDSEVLAHLAAATELKLLGLDGTQEWIFVEYAGEPGQIIRGWVSADYAQLQLNGRPVSVATLRALDETVAPEFGSLTRGGIRVAEDAGPTPIPPPDETMVGVYGKIDLDPGAMLHLRRNPSADAESLALIPAGTSLPLSGVTENAEWLKASYDDKEGWIFARYVLLLLRGRLYNRDYLESLLPPHDSQGFPSN